MDLLSTSLLISVALVLAGCAASSDGGEARDDAADPLPDFDRLWNYGDPAATAEKFRALLPRFAASDDRDRHAQLLTQIARTHGLRRDFETSVTILAEAEALIDETTPVAQVRLLLERGRTFRSSGDPDAARPFFTEAFERANAIEAEFHAVDAAHMLGIVESGDLSLEWNRRAIAAAEAASDPRARNWLGALYNNTAWTLHDSGDLDGALDLFEKCLAWHEEKGTGRPRLIAKWAVARALRSLGRVDDALARQEALRDEWAASEFDPSGYVFEEIGECLLLLAREDEAPAAFAKAYAILSKDDWLVAEEPARLERMRTLAGEQPRDE